MKTFDPIFTAGKIIPVLSYNSVDEAVKTSRTLFEAGLRVFEITLRHDSALEAIAAVIADLPDEAIVGAGTITTPQLALQATAAGAQFGVSPGLTSELADTVNRLDWALLPGVTTVSEAMASSQLGFSAMKFFPAEVSGGTDFLKAIGSVLPDIQFCPTGGINPGNAQSYLALPNVAVIGGSWLIARTASGSVDQEETGRRAEAVKALS